ncbi:MAG: F0F1 ATP synthase subunit epsilon [Chloroflexota bacterium]|nr:F0F1 ATP synthase subunit epsilon [Chloroflexota bacterium]
MAKLHVEIVTGERVILTEDDVDMVIAPGSDGTLGILPRHAPLISTLDAGELRIKKDGREESIIVFGGFIEVTPEKVIVLADTAERAEEIDLARAEESRRSAETAISNRESTMELEAAADALRRANIRLRIGQRRGSRRGSSDSG